MMMLALGLFVLHTILETKTAKQGITEKQIETIKSFPLKTDAKAGLTEKHDKTTKIIESKTVERVDKKTMKEKGKNSFTRCFCEINNYRT